MKNIYLLTTIIIYIFFTNYNITFSQQINKWEIADSDEINYMTYFLNDGNISGFNENDIVIVGGSYGISDYKNNRYKIIKYTDKCNKQEIIYNDTVSVCQRLHSIAHPTKKLIVVVGDTNTLLVNINNSDYYKSFGMIIISTDSGLSWQRKSLDSNKEFRCISMCDSLNGIILQKDIDNFYNKLEGLKFDSLLITNNGWQNYRKIPIPENAYVTYCWCLTSQNYFLLCYDLDNKRYYLYKTIDSGYTWIKTTYFDDNIQISDLKLVNEKIIFAAGSRKVKKNSSLKEPVIYRSNDGGDKWQECKNVFREKQEDLFALYSIDFCDSLNGLAVGSKGTILRTSDGGDIWIREYSPYKFAESFAFDNLQSVFYPKIDFAFALWSRNYSIKWNNQKFLTKPLFYKIINSNAQPVNNVLVKWTSVDGAKKYSLKVDSTYPGGSTYDMDFDNPPIDTILNDTSIVMNNLEYDYYYNFWVKAIAENIESDWSKSYDGFGNFHTIPNELALYSPELIYPPYSSRVESSNASLVWNRVPTADSYSIKIENNKNSYIVDERITDTTYTLENIEPSAFYYVTLVSYKGINYSNYTWSYFGTKALLQTNEESYLGNSLNINFFPNPANNICHASLNTNITELNSIVLYNILGLELKKVEFLKTQLDFGFQIEFVVSSLENGIYYLVLRNSHRSFVGAFIVNR